MFGAILKSALQNIAVLNKHEKRMHITFIFLSNGRMLVSGRNVADKYLHMFSKHSERDAFDNLFAMMKRRHDLKRKIIKNGIIVVNLAYGVANQKFVKKISKPCLLCAKYLKKIHNIIPIKKIYWTQTSDEWEVCNVCDVENGATLSEGEK